MAGLFFCGVVGWRLRLTEKKRGAKDVKPGIISTLTSYLHAKSSPRQTTKRRPVNYDRPAF